MKSNVPSSSKSRRYTYFCHVDCEYFPCHAAEHPGDFNCLFCYCPLYALGEHCGGNFTYNANNIKDCSRCLLPHKRESYAYILSRLTEIVRPKK